MKYIFLAVFLILISPIAYGENYFNYESENCPYTQGLDNSAVQNLIENMNKAKRALTDKCGDIEEDIKPLTNLANDTYNKIREIKKNPKALIGALLNCDNYQSVLNKELKSIYNGGTGKRTITVQRYLNCADKPDLDNCVKEVFDLTYREMKEQCKRGNQKNKDTFESYVDIKEKLVKHSTNILNKLVSCKDQVEQSKIASNLLQTLNVISVYHPSLSAVSLGLTVGNKLLSDLMKHVSNKKDKEESTLWIETANLKCLALDGIKNAFQCGSETPAIFPKEIEEPHLKAYHAFYEMVEDLQKTVDQFQKPKVIGASLREVPLEKSHLDLLQRSLEKRIKDGDKEIPYKEYLAKAANHLKSTVIPGQDDSTLRSQEMGSVLSDFLGKYEAYINITVSEPNFSQKLLEKKKAKKELEDFINKSFFPDNEMTPYNISEIIFHHQDLLQKGAEKNVLRKIRRARSIAESQKEVQENYAKMKQDLRNNQSLIETSVNSYLKNIQPRLEEELKKSSKKFSDTLAMKNFNDLSPEQKESQFNTAAWPLIKDCLLLPAAFYTSKNMATEAINVKEPTFMQRLQHTLSSNPEISFYDRCKPLHCFINEKTTFSSESVCKLISNFDGIANHLRQNYLETGDPCRAATTTRYQPTPTQRHR